MNNKEVTTQSPILIPSESIIEGYIKTKKSFRIECNYFGTIMSSQKVVIGNTSKIIGDIICRNLDISGELIGNIFCSGKIKVNSGSKIKGKIYTKLFENDEKSELDCVIQIPTDEHISKVEELFENLDTTQSLSSDNTLGAIRNIFYENVYSHRSNPDIPLVHDFTSQRNKIEEQEAIANKQILQGLSKPKVKNNDTELIESSLEKS